MSAPAQPATVFVVDDDLGLARLIERALKRAGHTTASASSGADAIQWLGQHRPDLLLLDLKLQDLEGGELISHLEAVQRTVPFIVITGQGDERVAVEMMKRGALDYVVKDAQFLDLVPAVVQRALAQIERERRLVEAEAARREAEGKLAAAHDRLAEDLADMARLHEFTMRLLQQGDLQSLFEQIIDAAISITRADMGNLQLLTPRERVLKIVAQRGFERPFLDFFDHVHEGQATCCGAALVQQARVVIEDVTASPLFAGTPALEALREAGVRAVQSTPLSTRAGRPLGMFSTHYRTPHRPQQRELWLLDMLARQAADLIERAEAEESLRHSEAMLDMAQQIAHLGSFEIELASPPKARWSDELFHILGVEPDALEPLSDEFFNRHVHPDDRERVRRTIEEGIRQAQGWKLEYRIVRPDGAVRHIQSSSEVVLVSGRASRIVGTMLDITERRRLEQEVLNISEQEQRRIGQDLHDGICQQLAGIELMAQVLEQTLAPRTRKLSAQAGQIARHMREVIAQTRQLAHGLCPVVLESEGLMAALRELAHDTAEMFRIECVFRCDKPVHIHDNATATHLYRIAQEAVANALKHGRARRIEIGLAAEADRLFLAVKDDGCGIPDPPPRNGAGLRIMQYRAGMIGGSVVVQRGEPGGTTVACSVHQSSPPR